MFYINSKDRLKLLNWSVVLYVAEECDFFSIIYACATPLRISHISDKFLNGVVNPCMFFIIFFICNQVTSHSFLTFLIVILQKWLGIYICNDHCRTIIFSHFETSPNHFQCSSYLPYIPHLHSSWILNFQTHQLTCFTSLIIIQRIFGVICIEFTPIFIWHHCIGNTSQHTDVCNIRPHSTSRFIEHSKLQRPRWTLVLCVNCISHHFYLKWFMIILSMNHALYYPQWCDSQVLVTPFCWRLYGIDVCFSMSRFSQKSL